MYKEILPLLRCPECHKKLEIDSFEMQDGEEIISGVLSCGQNHKWDINEGVLIFNVEEQKDANRWSEILQGRSLEEFDDWVARKTPQNQIELTKKAIDDIISFIRKNNPKFILDIATGRGQLAKRIVREVNYPYHLICTDLSPFVLKEDRKNLIPNANLQKINYVACDASNLPFNDNCLELITSLMGIMNMRDLMRKGITEAKRVLEKEHYFIDTVINVKKNSKSYSVYKEFLEKEEVKGIEKNLLRSEIKALHKKVGFKDVRLEIIGDSIAEENELDLIPVEGDWFSIGNIYANN
jgi:ubiquinone/menaquinone biosynthesis C-methylase UbiE/uncharacterized protein YbaR (Trm112 family)